MSFDSLPGHTSGGLAAGGEVEKISAPAAEAIRKSDLVISPMVLLELQHLFEIKRLVKGTPRAAQ